MGRNNVRLFFSPSVVFLVCQRSRFRFLGLVLWHLWIGRAKHPGLGKLELEVFNTAGWLTHADFQAVTEHRLIPSRARNGWSWLRQKGIHSVWSPPNQDSFHVGAAGVGIVSLQGALVTLPTSATAQFQKFYDQGTAVRRVLPIGGGSVMHVIVLYGYQGAAEDSEQLGLTIVLFDAALCELEVIDANMEPTKIRSQKGTRLGIGLIWKHAGLLLTGSSLVLSASVLGNLWVVPGRTLLLLAPLLLLLPSLMSC